MPTLLVLSWQSPSIVFRLQAAIALAILVLGNPSQASAEPLVRAQLPNEVGQPHRTLSVDSSYTLGTGDVVFIEIFNLPDYSREYQVLSDGTISLPLIGPLQVRGMSVNQVSEAAISRYTYYIRRPFISVELRQTRPIQVAISGEVNRPGSYTVPLGEGENAPTATKAIQLAGGITQSADIRSILIRRSSSPSSSQNDVISISLWDLIENGDLGQDIALRDGDSVLVPKATGMSPEEMLLTASASFSPSSIKVNVVGEVVEPGILDLPPNTPLNQAILATGGFNRRAAQRSVTLVRLNTDGTVSQQAIDINFEQGINDNGNPTLRNGDTVLVRRSGLASFTDTLTSVLAPVNGAFGLLRLLGL